MTTLLQSPAADGLYAKGICMSGVWEQKPYAAEEGGRALAESLMKELSVTTVEELEAVPYARLAAAYEAVRPAFLRENRYVGNQPFKNSFYAGDPLLYGFRKEPHRSRFLPERYSENSPPLRRAMRTEKRRMKKGRPGWWRRCSVRNMRRS